MCLYFVHLLCELDNIFLKIIPKWEEREFLIHKMTNGLARRHVTLNTGRRLKIIKLDKKKANLVGDAQKQEGQLGSKAPKNEAIDSQDGHSQA